MGGASGTPLSPAQRVDHAADDTAAEAQIAGPAVACGAVHAGDATQDLGQQVLRSRCSRSAIVTFERSHRERIFTVDRATQRPASNPSRERYRRSSCR